MERHLHMTFGHVGSSIGSIDSSLFDVQVVYRYPARWSAAAARPRLAIYSSQ